MKNLIMKSEEIFIDELLSTTGTIEELHKFLEVNFHKIPHRQAFNSLLKRVESQQEQLEKAVNILKNIQTYYESFLQCSTDPNKFSCSNSPECCCDPENHIYRDIIKFIKTHNKGENS